MHIHILGICGTFMGGLAILAKELGHQVTGSDANVYPPMSTQLEEQGIVLTQGFDPSQLDPAPDLVVVGNAMSRGNACVEYVLDRGLAYTSGPQWLCDHLLKDRWVLAVAGTHGKTTTASMMAWILQYAKLEPGFLIGGVPQNFGVSARLGNAPFFVIEADEYDSAFFDKRSKFVHYRPRTLVLNNLEFDHADIFDTLADIQKQFHHLLRMVPGNGLIVSPNDVPALDEVIEKGCWTDIEYAGPDCTWQAKPLKTDCSEFEIILNGEPQGTVIWPVIGKHNMQNGLMALAGSRHAGVPVDVAIEALAEFVPPKRRLELKGEVAGICLYDDFAHHPTAIATTLEGLRANVGKARILSVLEPRSNTMRMGVHQNTLAQSFTDSDKVFLLKPEALKWDIQALVEQSSVPVIIEAELEQLIGTILKEAQKGDHILVMSNGGFGGIHQKLLDALAKKFSVEA